MYTYTCIYNSRRVLNMIAGSSRLFLARERIASWFPKSGGTTCLTLLV